jgi:hypothetical protein
MEIKLKMSEEKIKQLIDLIQEATDEIFGDDANVSDVDEAAKVVRAAILLQCEDQEQYDRIGVFASWFEDIP